MKNHSVTLFAYCLFLVVIFSSPSITLAIDEHIQHFGYYWGMSGINEVSSYVTTMFIDNTWTATGTTSSVIALANKDIKNLATLYTLGIKGIVNVTSVFYFRDQGHFKFRSDYEARWNTYWGYIYPHLSKIASFIPMDEPTGDMNNYATAVQRIKSKIDKLPKSEQIPILMVITPDQVLRIEKGTLSVPPEISWLGFDEYGCWGNECYKGKSIPAKFQLIVDNAKEHPGRKVIVIPDAVFKSETNISPSPKNQQENVERINNFYKLCKNEPLCVGMFPFLWKTQSYKDGWLIGAEDMSIVEQRLKQIGLEINYDVLVANFGKTGTPGWIRADFIKNGKVDIFDYNVLVENFGK